MTQVQKVIAIDAGLSPLERMKALGLQNQKIMSARIKALDAGMTVIHNELCKMTAQNELEQRELLASNPELMLWAAEA